MICRLLVHHVTLFSLLFGFVLSSSADPLITSWRVWGVSARGKVRLLIGSPSWYDRSGNCDKDPPCCLVVVCRNNSMHFTMRESVDTILADADVLASEGLTVCLSLCDGLSAGIGS